MVVDVHTEFSPLDQIGPDGYYTFILGFESHPENFNNDGIFSILQEGLSQLVEQYPVLAAEITRNESNHLIIDQSKPAQILLIRKDLTHAGSEWTGTYQELKMGGIAPARLDEKILTPLMPGGVSPTRKLISAQVNFIEGGTLLTVSFSHLKFDAKSAASVTGEWARLCREFQQGSGNIFQEPCYISTHGPNQVTALASRTDANYEKLKNRIELWELCCIDGMRSPEPRSPERTKAPSNDISSPKVVSHIFVFSQPVLRKLKAKANAYLAIAGADDVLWVSTLDSLTAFLWRHILRAKFPMAPGFDLPKERSKLAVAVDGRKVLSIPDTYIGNVVFEALPTLPIQKIISPETNLGYLAATIRSELMKCASASLLKEALALASSIPNHMLPTLLRLLDDPFGSEVLTTSWVNLPIYGMNWGDAIGNRGFIDFFRVPGGQAGGVNFILPQKKNGSLEVSISLKEHQMGRLMADKEFLGLAALVG